MTDIRDLVKTYACSLQCAALAKMSTDDAVRRGYVEGARASAMAMLAAGMRERGTGCACSCWTTRIWRDTSIMT